MSANEVMTTSPTGAMKAENDERYDLIPVEPLRLLARHYGVGAKKYADRNWEKGIEWHKNFASANRHMQAFWGGEDIDAETGTPHVISAAWHMFALAEYMTTHPELDDRPTTATERHNPLADIVTDFHGNPLFGAEPVRTVIPTPISSVIAGGTIPDKVSSLDIEQRPYKWLDGDGWEFSWNGEREVWVASSAGRSYEYVNEPVGEHWDFLFTRVKDGSWHGGEYLPLTTTALYGSLWKREHRWRVRHEDGTYGHEYAHVSGHWCYRASECAQWRISSEDRGCENLGVGAVYERIT